MRSMRTSRSSTPLSGCGTGTGCPNASKNAMRRSMLRWRASVGILWPAPLFVTRATMRAPSRLAENSMPRFSISGEWPPGIL
jgi:hypothetical protein